MIIVDKIQHRTGDAIRSLLIVNSQIAGSDRTRHSVQTDCRCIPPYALVTSRPKRHLEIRAQCKDFGDIASHGAERVRGLYFEARWFVLSLYDGARIERFGRLQVPAEVAAMLAVHDEVLHKDPVVAGRLLHGARELVAMMQRVE